MGVYSDVIGRYLTAKWVELVIMLFLWSVALIFYLHLEHPRIVKARNQRDRSKKNGSLRVAQKRLTRERRYCAFYVSLFALILGGCLWTYLTDMIPALRDRNNGAYTEYTGELACDDRLGGLNGPVSDPSGVCPEPVDRKGKAPCRRARNGGLRRGIRRDCRYFLPI